MLILKIGKLFLKVKNEGSVRLLMDDLERLL